MVLPRTRCVIAYSDEYQGYSQGYFSGDATRVVVVHRDADGKDYEKPGDECEYGGGAEARVGGGCGAPGFGDGVPVPKDGQEERLLES